MRVGIDAQMLCRSITGIERYAFEVIQELTRLRPDVEFFLYAPLPIKAELTRTPNLTIRHSNVKFRGAGTLWAQTTLPRWAASDGLDVFWCPTHRLPRFLDKKIARVVTIHDLVWKYAGETMHPLNRLAEHLLMPDAIKLADRVVAVSESTAAGIRNEFRSARDKIRVVYHGVTRFPSPGSFDALAGMGINRSYFLFVGTLEPRKNLWRLLEAYAKLNSEEKARALFVIAGGKGWGNEDLVALIRKLGLADSVRLTGYVNEQTLSTLYQHVLFLAMPSLYEGFGLPLVEAMSFGVPVLTSSCSSLPEVAGDAGLLVDPLSVDSIAEGLSQMLTNNDMRNALALRAGKQASRFTWEHAARQLLAIFQEAIDERRKRQA